ncbi:hypothetical protein BTA51_26005 [Hahella sp. CCB-MM4]|uniref:helix-turn-helix domain-containing protein n=1 Tax=Hahella sp. (strain CCB-MM4) TaxID=1926491 RepID=UPI000B9BA085|nr:helix-turn-helix transcriptional regulator [Hahella sp. CCB-MM4]OZG70413.1 hypothetical protein BTA51_25945 [Hahella sp. CCB-MM4]OZG70425.1 hypothetical protein BTA51_26005 [Hahella sp. CCB-MM4]
MTKDDDQNMTLAENLQRIRAAKGWSRKKLADEAGLTEGAITKIEHGSDPKAVSIKRLVIALGCTADELLFAENEIDADDQFKVMLSEIKKLPSDDKEFLKEMLRSGLMYCQTKYLREI